VKTHEKPAKKNHNRKQAALPVGRPLRNHRPFLRKGRCSSLRPATSQHRPPAFG